MSTDRSEMVRVIREVYGLDSPRVTYAMMKVPRERFAPKKHQSIAYQDQPVDIGYGQTMSQPYTVAMMTDLAVIPKSKNQNSKTKGRIDKKSKVLELGTGSGYQAAILSFFFDRVYTLEIIPELAIKARKTLKRLGYDNVSVKTGNGRNGWGKKGLFDAIMITAGIDEVPEELLDQLKVGGVLVAPVGKGYDKKMTRFTKRSGLKPKFRKEEFGTFHFVPFI